MEQIHGRQSRVSLITFLLCLAAAILLTGAMVRPYLLSLFMGGMLAMLFYPVFKQLRRRGLGPKLASALTTLGMIVLVIGPLSLFVVLAVRQGVTLGQQLVANRNSISIDSIATRLAEVTPLGDLIGSPQALEEKVRAGLQSGATRATALVMALAGMLPDLGLQLVLACIACFFLLVDGRRFLAWADARVPLDRDVRTRLNKVFRDMAVSTIWATLAAAAVQSAVMVVAFLSLGVPATALAAGATFIFSWIPLMGSTPVWGGAMIYLWTQGRNGAVLGMLAFGLLTGIVDNLVRPLVLKGRGELHPLTALVSIFGGVSLFGILGVFIGPIVASVLIALLQLWPMVGQREGIRVEGGPGKRQPAA